MFPTSPYLRPIITLIITAVTATCCAAPHTIPTSICRPRSSTILRTVFRSSSRPIEAVFGQGGAPMPKHSLLIGVDAAGCDF